MLRASLQPVCHGYGNGRQVSQAQDTTKTAGNSAALDISSATHPKAVRGTAREWSYKTQLSRANCRGGAFSMPPLRCHRVWGFPRPMPPIIMSSSSSQQNVKTNIISIISASIQSVFIHISQAINKVFFIVIIILEL